jgi:hypothetical protein
MTEEVTDRTSLLPPRARSRGGAGLVFAGLLLVAVGSTWTASVLGADLPTGSTALGVVIAAGLSLLVARRDDTRVGIIVIGLIALAWVSFTAPSSSVEERTNELLELTE